MCFFSCETAVNEVLSKTFSFAIVSLITMQIRSALIWCREPWKHHHHHHIVSLTLINLSEMVLESLFFAIYRGTKQQIHHQHFSYAHNPGSIFLKYHTNFIQDILHTQRHPCITKFYFCVFFFLFFFCFFLLFFVFFLFFLFGFKQQKCKCSA